jgi:hypothetical protein
MTSASARPSIAVASLAAALALASAPAQAAAGYVPAETAPLLSLISMVVVATTTLLVSACVLLHYETLHLLSFVLLRFHGKRRRRILVLVFALLALAVAEIWVFGFGYDLLLRFAGYGALHGPTTQTDNLLDYVYFSASIYTTLGLGDFVPSGSIRFLVGMEALVGFTLISWSAAFTFLEMERFWRDSTARRHRAAYGTDPDHDDPG